MPDALNGAMSRLAAASNIRVDAPLVAVDQRISILKVLFVEANRDRPDDFLDEGLRRYDLACAMAKMMLKEEERRPDNRRS